MSAPGGRRPRQTADALAGVGLVLAMLFLMFASAIAGFAVGRHGDGNDKKTPVSTTQTANETVTTSGDETSTAAETTTSAAGGGSQLAEGKRIFTSAGCVACHTLKAAGATGNVGPNLDDVKPSYDKVIERVTQGKPPMPSFRGKLSASEIQAVARFVSSSTRGSS